MDCLFDTNKNKLIDVISKCGVEKYRANQIYSEFLNGKNIEEINNIPKNLKNKLIEFYLSFPLKLNTVLTSKIDGSKKFLFELNDHNFIESVFIKNQYGNTLCLSTQVGCAMGCIFCESGKYGLIRNLVASEIATQFILINKYLCGTKANRKFANIVLMGSGEPLDNYYALLEFLEFAKNFYNISMRNISISTCGLVPKIYQLADASINSVLCISLHATQDDLRQKLMKIAKIYSIKEIINATKYYFAKSKRKIIYEYVMLRCNTKDEDIERLYKFTRGYETHINLIQLNNTSQDKNELLVPLNKDERKIFADKMEECGLSFSIRRSVGKDIMGACGQLKNYAMQKQNNF